MTDKTLLFVASAGLNDVSVARREIDGTLRRATHANINWIQRFTAGNPPLVSLFPEADLGILNDHLEKMLGIRYAPAGYLDVTQQLAGYFIGMRKYHGSDYSLEIATPPVNVKQLSDSVGVPVQSYDPDKNSANRLNWTLRLWERLQN